MIESWLGNVPAWKVESNFTCFYYFCRSFLCNSFARMYYWCYVWLRDLAFVYRICRLYILRVSSSTLSTGSISGLFTAVSCGAPWDYWFEWCSFVFLKNESWLVCSRIDFCADVLLLHSITGLVIRRFSSIRIFLDPSSFSFFKRSRLLWLGLPTNESLLPKKDT